MGDRVVHRPMGPQTTPADRRTVEGATSPTLACDGGTVEDDPDADHLQDVPDGAGCTELWQYLSSQRAAEDDPDR